MDSHKKKNIIRYISFAIAFTMTIAVSVMCKGNNAVASEVIKTSEEINKKCPITIDAYTILDNTTVTENPLTLVYLYTVRVNKDSLTVNLDESKKNIMKTTQNAADTDPQMAYIRDNSVLLKYHYKDKNGKYLFDFTITPKKNTK
ncbi:hypothetical protein [Flavobacterium cerinum]|uniref:Uncharacterized protein n=1 Tax=Flavobacterium cerinum TaxID=2502784 RepID=A0A3S3QUA3_9FLAO|nr:hypothetical protein [Flavobacterium cerinum]RWW92336.1 hypothetical protein EPI11_15610 [Flavobacterium cerinum]